MDVKFEHPRLVPLYDSLEGDRSDLDAYLAVAIELAAESVLDVGCGTGVFALMLADRGIRVIGVDPAQGSVAFARAKHGADRVTWVDGDTRSLPAMQVDLATMTGNVAQAIVDQHAWRSTLRDIHRAVRVGGHLVFETRVPDRRAWEEWTEERTREHRVLDGVGTVEYWTELVEVAEPLVTFRGSYLFPDGARLTSDSTLRFRARDEVQADLEAGGWQVAEVRDAPARPGLEYVFVCRRER